MSKGCHQPDFFSGHEKKKPATKMSLNILTLLLSHLLPLLNQFGHLADALRGNGTVRGYGGF